MSSNNHKEQAAIHQIKDAGRLRELDNHQLLTDQNEQIATFDQVKEIGRWFLDQEFNTVLPSTKPFPVELLGNATNDVFLAKLALAADLESQFPVTVEVVQTPQGLDLLVHIVPIHFGALEVAQFGQHTDSLLALAAAAAVAPQFLLGLNIGLRGDCSISQSGKSLINVDHGTPLAAIFESFQDKSHVINSAAQITGSRNITLKQAAHLHHLPSDQSNTIQRGAGLSRVAAGVSIQSRLRSQLPKHVLFIPTHVDQSGQAGVTTLNESLLARGSYDLGLMATALGMTSTVVGDSKKEKKMERILSAESGDVPLINIVRS